MGGSSLDGTSLSQVINVSLNVEPSYYLTVKRKPICIALITSYPSLGAQLWHVLTRDHTVLPATHTFIHKWNEPYLPLTPSRGASPH